MATCWRYARSILIGAVLALILAPATVAAHPHVWIEARLGLHFREQRLVGLQMTWRFDELFSSWLIEQHSPAADGSFAPPAAAAIEAEAFGTLAEFGFLTHLRVDGEPRALDRYVRFAPRVEAGRLVYGFVLPVTPPLDPRRQRVTVGLFDETFYIDLAIDPEAMVTLEGDVPAGCQVRLREDVENPIYFGLVNPLLAELVCE